TVAMAVLTRTYLVVPPDLVWSILVMVASLAAVAILTVAMGVTEEDKLVLRTVLRKVRRSRGGA
ncbi:hypothetical protein KAW64_08610, partial [bacterium]|nr:hypothetical protein [bacterium]